MFAALLVTEECGACAAADNLIAAIITILTFPAPIIRPSPAPGITSHTPAAYANQLRGARKVEMRGSGDGGEADHPQPRWWSNSIGLNGTCEIYLISFGYIKYYLAFELRLQV